MARQRRLTDDQVVELLKTYRAGASVYQLASRYGITRQTVSEHLKRSGVARRYRLLDEPAVQDGARLYKAGWSLARLAKHYGVAPHTVRRALLKAGVTMRSSYDHLL